MYRSLFVDGKIINPVTGKTAVLRMVGNEGIVPGKGLGDVILPYLQSIEINMKRGANTELRIQFAPTYEMALDLLSKGNPWIRLGNTLAIRWGYSDVPGSISDWYYGFIQMPEPTFGEEISFAVSAKTLIWNAERVERIQNWCKNGPRSFRSIASEIGERYGFEVLFVNTNPASVKEVEREGTNFFQGGMTDLQWLIIESEKIGLRFMTRNGKMYFMDVNAPWNKWAYSATFRMYGKIEVNKNVYPMLSFSPEQMGTLFLQSINGVSCVLFGPNDDPAKEPEQVVSKDEDAKGFSSNTNLGAQADEKKTSGLKDSDKKPIIAKTTIATNPDNGETGRAMCLPLDGTETSEMLSSQVDSMREWLASDQGLIVNFSSIAIPNLLPGMFVNLEGVGNYFSTSYLLNEVNIRVDSGGGEMECVAYARGWPSVDAMTDAFTSSINYEKPPEDPDGTGNETKEP